MMQSTVEELAQLVGGAVHGDGAGSIHGVGDLRLASQSEVAFVRSGRYLELARGSGAGALLVGEAFDLDTPQIVVADPQIAFAVVAAHFHPLPFATEHSVHPSASIDPTAELVAPVQVGSHVVVEAGAFVGAGTILGAGSVVGTRARIGERGVLHPRAVLYEGVTLGARVVVHSGAVIGSDGFGFVPDARGSNSERDFHWIKVPQVGSVEVGDDVEIGANTTIDRGTLGNTKIGRGSKIDNIVHIGHNCVLGEHNIVAGFCAFSGSTVLGDRVSCAGHVVSGGHLRICDDVRIGGNSAVTSDVDEPGDYMGYPLQKRERWGRSRHILDHLVELKERLRALERERR